MSLLSDGLTNCFPVSEYGIWAGIRHVPVKMTSAIQGGSISELIERRDNTRYAALCDIREIWAIKEYSITPTGLRTIQEEGTCDACILRVGLMAVNDLVFTNEGLNYLLKLLGEHRAD